MGRLPSLVPEKFYNYVSNAEPAPPGGVEEGETWYEPDTANSYVYDGGVWVDLTVVAHSQLTGVGEADHHSPVSVGAPLTIDGGQGIDLSVGSGLTVNNGTLEKTGGYSKTDLINDIGTESGSFNVSPDSAGSKTIGLSNNYAKLIADAGIGVFGSGNYAMASVTSKGSNSITIDFVNENVSSSTTAYWHVFGVVQ